MAVSSVWKVRLGVRIKDVKRRKEPILTGEDQELGRYELCFLNVLYFATKTLVNVQFIGILEGDQQAADRNFMNSFDSEKSTLHIVQSFEDFIQKKTRFSLQKRYHKITFLCCSNNPQILS